MTIGDVMGMTAVVAATGATLWAAQVSCAVLFENKTRRATNFLETQTMKTLWVGVALTAVGGLIGVGFIASKNGLLGLVGWTLLAILISASVLGAAGLAMLAAERVKRFAPRLSTLAALGRGAGLLIAAGFFPVFGWLFFFPVAFAFSLGAGWRALTYRVARERITETASVAAGR
jgi:hypothetical protein